MDEVLVVDSGSTDGTKAIALSFSNVKWLETPWLGYSGTRQWAFPQAKNVWILWVDADEAVSLELMNDLTKVIHNQPRGYWYECPRRTYFMNEWIRYCGWYPGYVKRFFNREVVGMNGAVLHEDLAPLKGAIPEPIRLKGHLHHYSYQSVSEYFSKMVKYGKPGAEEMLRKEKNAGFGMIVLNPIWTFFRFFILLGGFRQGRTGFIISAGSAFSNFIKYVNFYYLKKNGNGSF